MKNVTLYKVERGAWEANLRSEEFIEGDEGYRPVDGLRSRLLEWKFYIEKRELAPMRIGRSPQEAISLAVSYELESVEAAKKALAESERLLSEVLKLKEKF